MNSREKSEIYIHLLSYKGDEIKDQEKSEFDPGE